METNIEYLNNISEYKRIIIIGCPGSGKSTLSTKLSNILHINVVHLDKLYWKENWRSVDDKEFDKLLLKELHKKSWIIDGNYSRTLSQRIKSCDLIIYLNLSSKVCLNSYISRVNNNGNKGFITDKCEEKLDNEFIQYIKEFNKLHKKENMRLLKECQKPYIIFSSRKEVNSFIALLLSLS